MSLLRDSPATKRTSDSWSSQLHNKESTAMARIFGNSVRLLMEQKSKGKSSSTNPLAQSFKCNKYTNENDGKLLHTCVLSSLTQFTFSGSFSSFIIILHH